MPHTDMTEKGLETIMVEYLRDHNGYEQGQSSDFDREHTLDPGRVERFIRATQPEKVEQTMCFAVESQKKSPMSSERDSASMASFSTCTIPSRQR